MTTRVDFYILESNPENPTLAVCRVLEKAYHAKQTVFVLTANEKDAVALDDLLWTFKEDNFIPHQLHSENPAANTPIIIGWQPPASAYDILVNLATTIPDLAWITPRVIEFVTPDNKTASRQRYQHYRDKACALHTHKI